MFLFVFNFRRIICAVNRKLAVNKRKCVLTVSSGSYEQLSLTFLLLQNHDRDVRKPEELRGSVCSQVFLGG